MGQLSGLACVLVAILIIILVCYRVYLFSSLTDFEIDHTNPRDVCLALNRYLWHEVGLEIVVAIFSLFSCCQSKITFVLYLAVLGWTEYRYRGQAFKYEPISIVRDMNRHKIECFARLIISALAFICALTNIILWLIGS